MACTECRRRKLRCDDQQPQCRNCETNGLVCQTSDRHARGPKRGHMAALRKRIADLEDRLASQDSVRNGEHVNPIPDHQDTQNIPNWMDANGASLQTENNSLVIDSETFSNLVTSTTSGSAPPVTATSLTNAPLTPASLTGTIFPPVSLTSLRVTTPLQIGSSTTAPLLSTSGSTEHEPLHTLTGFIPAELDELYFERIHPAIPLLNQRNYLSWSKNNGKKKSQSCLQYAMWTVATLQSAQFRYLQDSLYQSCTEMLTSMCSSASNDPFDREQIQAWLLITVYELMRSLYRQAWISVGRAFRLIQLLRFHELDDPSLVTPAELGFVEREEERRAFWLAYFLDHLFAITTSWPITLNELVVCTRLTVSEHDFQNNQPAAGSFLSEAMTEQQPHYPSPFNEAIILATLCGRRLLYRQQLNVRSTYGDVDSNWKHSNLMLDKLLTQRLNILSQCCPSPHEATRPMVHFVNTMAQCSVIFSCTDANVLLRAEEESPIGAEYHLRAITAAEETINLAHMLANSFVFKRHPLASIPIMFCAEFLFKNRSVSEEISSLFERLLKIFEQISDLEDHSQSYIHVMNKWMKCSAKVSDRLR